MADRRWRVLAAGMAAQASIAAVGLGLPAIAPQLRDRFDLSLAGTGALLAASTLGVLVGLLPWGATADRLGERPVVVAGLAGAALALALAALADSALGVAAGLFLAGLLGAAANVGSGRAVARAFPRRQRGLGLGLRHMATPLGGALGAAALPVAVAVAEPRAAFLLLAGLCALGALAAAAGLVPPPARDPQPARRGPGPLRDPRIWRLSVGTALVVVAQIAVLSFLTLYLHLERGWSVGAAAAALVGLQLVGGASRVLAGALSDRLGARVRVLRGLALAAAAALAVAAALLALPDVPAAAALLVAGILAMSGNGVSFAAAAELAGLDRAGTALGLQNTVLFVAVAIAPPAFGAAVAGLGWTAAFALVAVLPLLGAAVLSPLAARERGGRRDQGDQQPDGGDGDGPGGDGLQLEAATPTGPRPDLPADPDGERGGQRAGGETVGDGH